MVGSSGSGCRCSRRTGARTRRSVSEVCRSETRVHHPPSGTFLPASSSPACSVHGTVRTAILQEAILDLDQVPVGQLAVEVPYNRGVAEQGMRFHHPAAAGLLWVLAHVLQVDTKAVRIP